MRLFSKKEKRVISILNVFALILSLVFANFALNPEEVKAAELQSPLKVVRQAGVTSTVDVNPDSSISIGDSYTSGGAASAGLSNATFILYEIPTTQDFTIEFTVGGIQFNNTSTSRAFYAGAFKADSTGTNIDTSSTNPFISFGLRGGMGSIGYGKKTSTGTSDFGTFSVGTAITATSTESYNIKFTRNSTSNSYDASIESTSDSTKKTSGTITGPTASGLSGTDNAMVGIMFSGVTTATISNLKITIAGQQVYPASGPNPPEPPASRNDWNNVANPVLGTPNLSSETAINIPWNMVMGPDGADILDIVMKKSDNTIAATKTVTTSGSALGTVTFNPTTSDSYSFQATAKRTGETAEKLSNVVSLNYSAPLAKPTITGISIVKTPSPGLGLTWGAVSEATSYVVSYSVKGANNWTSANVNGTKHTVTGLTEGITYQFKVMASRNSENSPESDISEKLFTTAVDPNAPVPEMEIVDLSDNYPLIVFRDAGNIRLIHRATSGGWNSSNGLSNSSYLIFPSRLSGDFEISADITVLSRGNAGTGGGVYLGAFVGTGDPKNAVITAAIRNDGGVRAYYKRASDNTFSATGTAVAIPLETVVSLKLKRSNGDYIISYSPDGGFTTSTTITSAQAVSDLGGDLFPGIILNSAEVKVENLYFKDGSGAVVFDSTKLTGQYEPVRPSWDSVTAPTLSQPTSSGANINVPWQMVVGLDGADTLSVEMMDSTGAVIETIDTTSTGTSGTASFTPKASGNYTFTALAKRGTQAPKQSISVSYSGFILPLAKPMIMASTGVGGMNIKWDAVPEATSYIVEYKLKTDTNWITVGTPATNSFLVTGLTVGSVYSFRVTAVRNSEYSLPSDVFDKTLMSVPEREWRFISTGNSTSLNVNTYERVDENTIKLKAATYNPSTLELIQQGGKILSNDYHDGLSFYYTEVDPTKENFEFTATFKVDYFKPIADGQEGFGIMAFDRLGTNGNTDIFYNNTVSLVANNFKSTVADATGVFPTIRPVMGTHFKVGLTKDSQGNILRPPTTDIKSSPFNNTVLKIGDTVTLTMKKTNTGFHTYINSDEADQRILYNPNALSVLYPDKIYVGLAVGRACNVTVTDISFTTTDPNSDPEPLPPPVEEVAPAFKVTSPSDTSSTPYNMVLNANANGKAHIYKGSVLLDEIAIVKGADAKKSLDLVLGSNSFRVIFTPDPDQNLTSYSPITVNYSVNYKFYTTKALYVSPTGASSNAGTIDSPLDIYTATKYALPGQPIFLRGGTYYLTSGLSIARGNDGTANNYKVLASYPGERAVLNFSMATGGFVLTGSYWKVNGIDVTQTIGNVKGFNIQGSYNIIDNVKTYKNGDTGLQISGVSTDPYSKWPAHNQIINCTSYDNRDPADNNADGFAAKLTVGPGNIFKGCLAYNNADDGWDLFGGYGMTEQSATVIEDSVAWGTRTLTDGTVTKGDGNGFKMGGAGYAIPNVLRNSITFSNAADGVTTNSNPKLIIENVTSFNNMGANISLSTYSYLTPEFRVSNTISYKTNNFVADSIPVTLTYLLSDSNYFFTGFSSVNKSRQEIRSDMFVSLDTSIKPFRNEDGSLNMGGLLTLTDLAPEGVGATINPIVSEVIAVPVEDPTPVPTPTPTPDQGNTNNSTQDTGGYQDSSQNSQPTAPTQPTPIPSQAPNFEVSKEQNGNISIEVNNVKKTDGKVIVSIPEGTIKAQNGATVTVSIPVVSSGVPKDGDISLSLTISDKDVKNIANGSKLVIDLGVVKVIVPSAAINPLLDKTTKNQLKIDVDNNKNNKNGIKPEIISSAIGDNSVYNVTVTLGNSKITKFPNNAPITIILPYQGTEHTKNKTVVYYVQDDGSLKIMPRSKVDVEGKYVSFNTNHLSSFVVGYNDVSFNDLAVTEWARSYIECIAARGIVVGDGKGIFNPSANVTRSEFAVMLINSFGALDSSAVSSFSDINSSMPFYGHVASAQKYSLLPYYVTFSPNTPITREEMATMVYRASIYFNIDISPVKSSIVFSDRDDISNWASNAVDVLSRAGFINGMGNGNFEPQSNLTRAQASVIIYNLLTR